jgi:hypothetical protein
MANFVKFVCEQCTIPFERSTNDIASARNKKTCNSYCSRKCSQLAQITKIQVSCLHCKKSFLKQKYQLSKNPNSFCSRSCAATYNNMHKTYGTRRSKIEIFLETQIREKYPDLKLLCNDKSTINSELDFYFPELQLAIELNGIFHYEPIFGESKLAQTQNNDNRKSFLCQKYQINLAVVDISGCKYFNQSAKDKYWPIIQQIIESAFL